jgi:hypothetical protein
MRRAPPLPTEADVTRLLDSLFERCIAENKLPQLFAAVIDKLSKTDPTTAIVVIRTLLEEALSMLPDEEREKLQREFAELAAPN